MTTTPTAPVDEEAFKIMLHAWTCCFGAPDAWMEMNLHSAVERDEVAKTKASCGAPVAGKPICHR